MTIDSTYHACCHGVGRHLDSCRRTIPAPAPSNAEVIGRLMEQIAEAAGPGTSVMTYTADSRAVVDVHGVDAARYPEWNADEPFAAVRIHVTKAGQHMISAQATTLLKALQLVASVMAFPPESGATLRLVPHGGA